MGIALSIYVSAATYLSQLVCGRDAPLISSSVVTLNSQLAETPQPSSLQPSSPATDPESQLPGTQPQVLSPAVNEESTQPQILSPAVNQEGTQQPQEYSIAINEQPTNTESVVIKRVPWEKILVAFCFAASLEIDLAYEKNNQHSKPNLTFISLNVSQLTRKKVPCCIQNVRESCHRPWCHCVFHHHCISIQW
ncbi:hypothetical protein NC653_010833 [Populus alba x Populus x berolinensis]|uniref:Uncharacterized protein n=1 Tax=Populus alba x Populus x berolinensis TaxID=444605 RepID=A0AAD6R0P9_9ROSI|nr:hypothetical protein NC653_010833 [Populus alba x Populus x berolinensis]